MIDALAFVEKEIVLADGRTVGDGLAADPWIRERLLAPILAVDEAGLPRYRLVYVELPRGHWKSGGIAAIATAEAALYPDTDVVVGAADTDQARIILENVGGYLHAIRSLARCSWFRATSSRRQAVTDPGHQQ